MCGNQISASRNGPPRDAPPPYVSPTGGFYPAAPPAYTPPPNGYYGWVPPTNVFPDRPAADAVYMTDMPPPYPGINGYNGYATASAPTAEAMGFAGPQQPSAADAKAMEAAQSAYYDPNRPQMAYVPPPAYYVSYFLVLSGSRMKRKLYFVLRKHLQHTTMQIRRISNFKDEHSMSAAIHHN